MVCALPSRFFLLVGSKGGNLNTEDIFVFDQKPDTYQAGTKLILHPPSKLKDKWSGLAGVISDNMFIVRDAQHDYILAVKSGGSSLVDLSTGSVTPSKLDKDNVEYLQKLLPLSSSNPLVYYSRADKSHKILQITKHPFDDENLTQAKLVDPVYQAYICNSDKGKIVASKNGNCGNVKWTIQAGFIDEQSVVLFDKTGSIISFPTSVFGTNGTTSVSFTNTSSKAFWVKYVPPTPGKYLNSI